MGCLHPILYFCTTLGRPLGILERQPELLRQCVHGRACTLPRALRLEPLRNFPVVADLVVDTGLFAQKLERVHAHVTHGVELSQRFVNCIECGLCISACPVAATSRDYLGPAVLAAAQPTMELDEVRSQVEGPNGVWRCHSAFECTEVCPAGVEPATTIMNMRKELLISVIRRKGK